MLGVSPLFEILLYWVAVLTVIAIAIFLSSAFSNPK
jgi:hypothetical protein